MNKILLTFFIITLFSIANSKKANHLASLPPISPSSLLMSSAISVNYRIATGLSIKKINNQP